VAGHTLATGLTDSSISLLEYGVKHVITSNVRIGSGLQGAQPVSDDENTGTESPKAVSLDGRDGEQCPNTCVIW
jgi:hypothetical protein